MSTFNLPLKEINLYYSLYLEEEGHKLLFENLYFFEYITVERIECMVTNLNDKNALDICESA